MNAAEGVLHFRFATPGGWMYEDPCTVDGEEVLHEIKHHPELERVPVIVLSGIDEDIVESQDLDRDADEDAVIQKPVDPGEFVEVIQQFEEFRLAVIRKNSDSGRSIGAD